MHDHAMRHKMQRIGERINFFEEKIKENAEPQKDSKVAPVHDRQAELECLRSTAIVQNRLKTAWGLYCG